MNNFAKTIMVSFMFFGREQRGTVVREAGQAAIVRFQLKSGAERERRVHPLEHDVHCFDGAHTQLLVRKLTAFGTTHELVKAAREDNYRPTILFFGFWDGVLANEVDKVLQADGLGTRAFRGHRGNARKEWVGPYGTHQRMPISEQIKKGLRLQGAELTDKDVGQAFGDDFGIVGACDVGKRVWLKEFGLALENAEQRDASRSDLATTREAAKGMANDSELPKFFAAFCATSPATLTESQFSRVLEEFFYQTFDAFISGDGDRSESMIKFAAWLNTNHPAVKPTDVFYAVDSVHAYT